MTLLTNVGIYLNIRLIHLSQFHFIESNNLINELSSDLIFNCSILFPPVFFYSSIFSLFFLYSSLKGQSLTIKYHFVKADLFIFFYSTSHNCNLIFCQLIFDIRCVLLCISIVLHSIREHKRSQSINKQKEK